MVPSNPGFPSCPCHISVTSSAHQSGSGCAVHFRTPPDEDFHRFTLNRVDLRYRSSRFNVAQQRRFLSTGGDWIGSKGCCRTLAPVVAAPARFLRHAASAVCPRLAIGNVGFPPWCLAAWRLPGISFAKGYRADAEACDAGSLSASGCPPFEIALIPI